MNIFDTAVLRRVVAQLQQPRAFLLGAYFPLTQEETTERIYFDVEERKNRITPFVHPTVAGKVVEGRGRRVSSFEPAYAKDKRRFDPDRAFKRAVGEQIGGGTVTPAAREAAHLRSELDDQLMMLTMREEVMASEALRTGKVTVAGEGYPTTVVDFGRHEDLTITLLTTDRWGEDGVKPLDNVEDWARDVQEKSGGRITDVTMDPKASRLFKADTDVRELLDTRRGSDARAELGPSSEKASYIGEIGDFRFWQCQETYVDEDGTDQKLLPDYTVIGGGPDVAGTRAYGAIRDPKAGYMAMRFFTKSWVEEDPAVRWLLLQTAPLMVPYRPNASFCATVHDGG